MGMGELRGKKFDVPGLGPSRPVFAVTRIALLIGCRGFSCLPEAGPDQVLLRRAVLYGAHPPSLATKEWACDSN